MKHPDHGIKAIVVTENKDICPESNIKIEGKVMSCKIPGVPGARWYIGCLIDQLKPATATQCVYYAYETYLEGVLIDGPSIIDRRLKTNRAYLSPDRDGDAEVFFFLPAKLNGKEEEGGYIRPKDWLIELKVYESDEYFDDPRIPLSSARIIMYRRVGTLPELEKYRNPETERLIIHYKWEYRCVELLPNFLGGKSLPTQQEGKTARLGVKQLNKEENLEKMSQAISRSSVPMGNTTCNPSRESPELLPEYFWGPRPKSPPAWEQRGRGFARLDPKSKKNIQRGRSPLGERVSDVEGLSVWMQKSVALQRAMIRGKRPMLPIRYPQMPCLPPGWELRYTNTYKVYYVNHTDKYTTWQHPLADALGVPEEDVAYEADQSDQDSDVYSDEDEQVYYIRDRLQQMDEKKELLRMKRATAEANVQKLLLGHVESSEWRETNLEHWFPEAEASESIIEHIHTYSANPGILKHAVQLRDAIIEEAICLDEELDEFEGSVPLTTAEPMSSGFSIVPKPRHNETGIMDDKRKKRNSEELEDGNEAARGLSNQNHMETDSNAGSRTGRVDYREDYGPEVPITRDGKIDPDWHRDKMARIEGPSESTTTCDLGSHAKIGQLRNECLSEQVDRMPITDSSDDDIGSDYEHQMQQAIEQSLQQYNMDAIARAFKSSTVSPNESSTAESSVYNWDEDDQPLLEDVSQWSSESDVLEDCGMETNRGSESSMSSGMRKPSTADNLRDSDVENDDPMETEQTPQPIVGAWHEEYYRGYKNKLERGTLVNAAELVNVDTNGQTDKWEDFDCSLSEQIPPLSAVDDEEDHDIENYNAFYAPPPYHQSAEVNQMNISPRQPLLVLRGARPTIVQNSAAALGRVLIEDWEEYEKLGVSLTDIQDVRQTTGTRANSSGTDQSSPSHAGLNPAKELEDDPTAKSVARASGDGLAGKPNATALAKSPPTVDPMIGLFDDRPDGGVGTKTSISKSKKGRKKRSKKNNTGDEDLPAPSIPLEGKDSMS